MTSSSAGITCISRSKRSFAARTKIGWGTNLVALFHAQYDTLCALSRHRRRRTSLVLRSESSKDQHARGWGNLLPFTLIKQSSSCVCTGVYGDSWTGLETCSAVEELIEECPSCEPAGNLVVSPRANRNSFEGENLELNLDQSVSVKSNQVKPDDDTENTVPVYIPAGYP